MTYPDQKLSGLLEFFKIAKYPQVPFQLNKYIVVHDVDSLITKLVSDIKNHRGSEKVLDSLFTHLRQLKEIILPVKVPK